jgi:hypothetical protein
MVAPSACEPGKDTPVIFFASPPLSARSATAFGRPFARCHGSRLFTLRLCFFYRPAVPFSTSPARRKVFTRPAKTSCPSRIECSLCPAFRRLSLSGLFPQELSPPESFVPCWCAVITVGPWGHCDSPTGRNRLRATSLDWQRLLIAARRSGSFSRFGPRANAVRGTGESCLVAATRVIRFRGTEPTSLAQSFPGRPGLSVTWLMQTFVSTNRIVLSMNCEQTIRNSLVVNKIICTGLFTGGKMMKCIRPNVSSGETYARKVVHRWSAQENLRGE